MRLTDAGEDKCQDESEEDSDEKTALSCGDMPVGHHEPHLIFLHTIALLLRVCLKRLHKPIQTISVKRLLEPS